MCRIHTKVSSRSSTSMSGAAISGSTEEEKKNGKVTSKRKIGVNSNNDADDHGHTAIQALLEMHTRQLSERDSEAEAASMGPLSPQDEENLSRMPSDLRIAAEKPPGEPMDNLHTMMEKLREESLRHPSLSFVMSSQVKCTLTVSLSWLSDIILHCMLVPGCQGRCYIVCVGHSRGHCSE